MKHFLKDLLSLSWTILGFFIAWIVLDGAARTLVGWCIIGTLVLHIATYPIRREDDGKKSQDEPASDKK
jgi:hypothetical protein